MSVSQGNAHDAQELCWDQGEKLLIGLRAGLRDTDQLDDRLVAIRLQFHRFFQLAFFDFEDGVPFFILIPELGDLIAKVIVVKGANFFE